eukprot:GHVT01008117.1.p1 GENE.GHVT01008117.1~~GHVT01008117.1.p1  ORF type:complete len:113 (-),score=5.41 GHVT01008117.1:493-831(-)
MVQIVQALADPVNKNALVSTRKTLGNGVTKKELMSINKVMTRLTDHLSQSTDNRHDMSKRSTSPENNKVMTRLTDHLSQSTDNRHDMSKRSTSPENDLSRGLRSALSDLNKL